MTIQVDVRAFKKEILNFFEARSKIDVGDLVAKHGDKSQQVYEDQVRALLTEHFPGLEDFMDLALHWENDIMVWAEQGAYKIDDFVMFYCGMGEVDFGVIKEIEADTYGIEITFEGDSHVRYVSAGDMRGPSSLEDQRTYERIRNGA